MFFVSQPAAMAEAAICRVYRRRWLMLFIFLLTSAVNALHWMQYAIIANIFQRYYSVSALAIEWTSMIYMVSYIPLVFPASWLLQMKVRVSWHRSRRFSINGVIFWVSGTPSVSTAWKLYYGSWLVD